MKKTKKVPLPPFTLWVGVYHGGNEVFEVAVGYTKKAVKKHREFIAESINLRDNHNWCEPPCKGGYAKAVFGSISGEYYKIVKRKVRR